MKSTFWKNRRVFVTGHTGFKGAWLTRWLSLLGADVAGYALPPPTQPNLYELCHIDECVRSTFGDVRDLAALTSALVQHRPEVVFHLAAQALVRRAYVEPVATFSTNVMGTVHLLEATRKADTVRAVVVVSSDKVYAERGDGTGHREVDPLGGVDCYSASKGCAELATAAYRASFLANQGVASARAGNSIGGGDWAEDRLIPDIVRAIVSNRPTAIRHPAAIRPWQHALDTLSGYLELAHRLWQEPASFAGAWNFGPSADAARSVGEVAQRFVDVLGRGTLELGTAEPDAAYEADTLMLDAAKARNVLGWQPRLNLERAIELTSEWYGTWLDGTTSLRDVLDDQIMSFVDR